MFCVEYPFPFSRKLQLQQKVTVFFAVFRHNDKKKAVDKNYIIC